MNQLALKNIDTILNINKDTELIFNKREISINNDNSEHINENNLNAHFSMYFTFSCSRDLKLFILKAWSELGSITCYMCSL